MSVSGFSVQHDFEVQEYNKRRATWKESEKKRKEEVKLLRVQAKAIREAALQQLKVLGVGEQKNMRAAFGWIRTSRREKSEKGPTSRLTEGKLLEDDSDGDSDEITLTDALAA
ncbi:hypothetical protein A1O7_03401 [Cladophialophora yegresii CBS 114405]|uniref:Uncharacterized protein n=1 Tax=Cladophialophora yegresii CBS 114405 TaxID=1182544 RepID=W9W4F3_9EURO|nr:uncharacterized protein A1O7_03401 [Cladophialophora yegresii CBS 114405]EXJ62957.1 hypothetical protein A1O7_03401 [Cladophialophora yegresii CBS 114405]